MVGSLQAASARKLQWPQSNARQRSKPKAQFVHSSLQEIGNPGQSTGTVQLRLGVSLTGAVMLKSNLSVIITASVHG